VRRSVPFLVLLLATTASCGQGDRDGPPQNAPADLKTYDVQAEDAAAPVQVPAARAVAPDPRAAAGPDIGPTAAPGVAFNYRYAFRLAAPRIAEVQEQHAQLCERLTVARCRITGLRYRVVNDRDIEAMLALKLDPTVARHFGRAGVEAVTRAEGMLIESEISGQDVGIDIRRATRSIAQLNEELRRIEARLAGRISADERARLDYEAQQLREAIRAAEAGREAQQESLATTPMVFNYGSGELVPGFADRPTFAKAWDQAWGNVKEGLLAFFVVLVTLAPWLLLGLLGWWATLRIRRRWFAKTPAATGEESAATA